MIRIGILGANGRMGQALLRSLGPMNDMTAVAALVRQGHETEGRSVIAEAMHGHELYYSSDLHEGYKQADSLIDFTLPDATRHNLEMAIAYEKPMVIGTTGLTADHHELMATLSHKVPVLCDTNMSVGIAVLNRLVEQTARLLGSDFDCEVMEMHHRHKKDLPSGTAVTLAKHVAKGYDQDLNDMGTLRVTEPHPPGLQVTHHRKPREIGLVALRGGGVYGDHNVVFASEEEVVTLSHRALNRDVFAKGALIATRWLQDQPPGLYSLKDIL